MKRRELSLAVAWCWKCSLLTQGLAVGVYVPTLNAKVVQGTSGPTRRRGLHDPPGTHALFFSNERLLSQSRLARFRRKHAHDPWRHARDHLQSWLQITCSLSCTGSSLPCVDQQPVFQ